MCSPAIGIGSAEQRDPCAVHRRVDRRADPQSLGELARPFRQPIECVVLNAGHLCIRQRYDAMIHPIEQVTVKIDKIAGYMDLRNLAFPTVHDFVSRGKALQQNRALVRPATVYDDIRTGADRTDGPKLGEQQNGVCLL
jgi:hypothetical protein